SLRPATSYRRYRFWITSSPVLRRSAYLFTFSTPCSGRRNSERGKMTGLGILQIAIFFGFVLLCVKPLGAYMAKVFNGQRTFMHPMLRWLETLTYKVIGVREDLEQRWTQYAAALLSFSIFGFLIVYLLQRAQGYLP